MLLIAALFAISAVAGGEDSSFRNLFPSESSHVLTKQQLSERDAQNLHVLTNSAQDKLTTILSKVPSLHSPLPVLTSSSATSCHRRRRRRRRPTHGRIEHPFVRLGVRRHSHCSDTYIASYLRAPPLECGRA